MTKRILAAAAVLCLPLLSRAAPAPTTYPWLIPGNVRIVQPAPVDNVTTFPSISSALASIASPSASNPYLVKVMPGVYTEYLPTVPAFVTLDGSGIGLTILNLGNEVYNYGTISNMTINGYAVLSDNSTLKQVQLTCNYYYVAVGAVGANVNIIDSVVQGTAGGIDVATGDVTLTRSKLVANNYALYLGGGKVTIDGSEVRANQAIILFTGGNVVAFRNSAIFGTRLYDANPSPGPLTFVSSQIATNYSVMKPGFDKMVNCYDVNYTAIPNM